MQDGLQTQVLAEPEGARQDLLMDRLFRARVRGKRYLYTWICTGIPFKLLSKGRVSRSLVIICENKNISQSN